MIIRPNGVTIGNIKGKEVKAVYQEKTLAYESFFPVQEPQGRGLIRIKVNQLLEDTPHPFTRALTGTISCASTNTFQDSMGARILLCTRLGDHFNISAGAEKIRGIMLKCIDDQTGAPFSSALGKFLDKILNISIQELKLTKLITDRESISNEEIAFMSSQAMSFDHLKLELGVHMNNLTDETNTIYTHMSGMAPRNFIISADFTLFVRFTVL
jgi:hypothetical protein